MVKLDDAKTVLSWKILWQWDRFPLKVLFELESNHPPSIWLSLKRLPSLKATACKKISHKFYDGFLLKREVPSCISNSREIILNCGLLWAWHGLF